MLEKIKLLLFAVAFLFFCQLVYSSEKAEFYVAKDGSNAWSGKLEAANAEKTDGPFSTLQRARDAVRTEKKRGLTVFVRNGTYYQTETFYLYPEDSGTTYAAYPGEQPVISGGTVLKNEWVKAENENKWRLELRKGERVSDLFMDGKRLQLARIPKKGFFKAEAVDNSTTEFKFNKGEFPACPDAASGVVLLMAYEWAEAYISVSKLDEEKCIITLAKSSGYPIVSKNDKSSGNYYIENLQAAVTEPGEWAFDKETSVLTLIPPEGVDPNKSEIIAGNLPVIVAVDGNVKKDIWTENVIFKGLTFQHSGKEGRWRHYEGTAVRLNGTKRCSIIDCRFTDLGGSGVVIWKECRENTVSGCEFVRTGDTPVHIFDYLGEGPAMSSGHRIVDNYIHHCNTVMKSISAISVAGSEGNLIAHNVIHDMPYIGINLSGTMTKYWQQKSAPELEPPFTAARIKPFLRARNNVFEYNYIHDVMQELYDGGGIYFWGTMGYGENIIRKNMISNVGKGRRNATGIYLDDETDDVRVYDNVVVGANIGTHLHGCPKNILENNLFAYSARIDISIQPEPYNVAPMNTTFSRNVMYMGFGEMFSTGESWNKNWDKKPIGEMDNNIYWRGGAEVKFGAGNLTSFDKNSKVADPFSTRTEVDNFTVKFGENAAKLGIRNIELKGVGLSRTSIWTEKAEKWNGITLPLTEEQLQKLSIMENLKKQSKD